MYVFLFACLFVCFFLSLILGTDVLAGYCKALIFYGSRGTWRMDGSHFQAKKDSFQGSKSPKGWTSYSVLVLLTEET